MVSVGVLYHILNGILHGKHRHTHSCSDVIFFWRPQNYYYYYYYLLFEYELQSTKHHCLLKFCFRSHMFSGKCAMFFLKYFNVRTAADTATAKVMHVVEVVLFLIWFIHMLEHNKKAQNKRNIYKPTNLATKLVWLHAFEIQSIDNLKNFQPITRPQQMAHDIFYVTVDFEREKNKLKLTFCAYCSVRHTLFAWISNLGLKYYFVILFDPSKWSISFFSASSISFTDWITSSIVLLARFLPTSHIGLDKGQKAKILFSFS